jgi:hypothetical protein
MQETEERTISRLVESLEADFPHVPRVRLRACVDDAFAFFDNATVRIYVPLLVARRAHATLRRFPVLEDASAGATVLLGSVERQAS